jgi:hypothetical protein
MQGLGILFPLARPTTLHCQVIIECKKAWNENSIPTDACRALTIPKDLEATLCLRDKVCEFQSIQAMEINKARVSKNHGCLGFGSYGTQYAGSSEQVSESWNMT